MNASDPFIASFTPGLNELGCHPLVGSPENIHVLQTEDAGVVEVIKSRTTRLVNKDIILEREMVRYYPSMDSRESNGDSPLSNFHARS